MIAPAPAAAFGALATMGLFLAGGMPVLLVSPQVSSSGTPPLRGSVP